jgi:DnaJ-class molecular chaperone
MSDPQKYYAALDLAPGAGDAEIKNAYRTLSRQYHPDRNPEEAAQQRMKEINQAYEVLSDPEKRAMYDRGGAQTDPGMGGPRPFGFQTHTGASNIHFSFGGGGPGGIPDIFSSIFGSMGGGGNPFVFMNRPQAPQPIKKIVALSLEQVATGVQGIKIPVERTTTVFDPAPNLGDPRCEHEKSQETFTLSVDIPPGITPDETLCVQGEGHRWIPFPESAQPLPPPKFGDITIQIQIEPHPHFSRKGNDLFYRRVLSIQEALCGIAVEVPAFAGRPTIQFGNDVYGQVICPGNAKVFNGLGFKRIDGSVGNLVVEFDVKWPERVALNGGEMDVLRGLLSRCV